MQPNETRRSRDRKKSTPLTMIFKQHHMKEDFGYSEDCGWELELPETLNLLREKRVRNVANMIFALVLMIAGATMTVPAVSAACA